MTSAHASDRAEGGAVYETEAATVNVRPRKAEGDRSLLEYAVETDHPAPVRVRVRQPIPDSTDLDDLGFPGECAEDWERDGDALLFERDVAPGATVRTAWGVEGELDEDLGEPTIEAEPVSIDMDEDFELDEEVLEDADDASAEDSADAPDEDASEAGASSEDDAPEGEPVLDLDDPDAASGGEDGEAPAAASESEDGTSVLESPPELDDLETAPEDETFSIPETGEDAPESADGDVEEAADSAAEESTDADDAAEQGESGDASDAAEASDESAADADDPAPAATDSVVRQLVAELHDEELDDSHRAALADALEVRLSDSTNAFVEHVRERQRRRAERIEDDLEALEESIDGLYGLKADASEVATLKRAITRLDDGKATNDDLNDLRDRVEELAETSVDEATFEELREDHESLAASLEETEEELASVETEAEEDREAIRERTETVADDLATLRDAAATEAALDDLEASLEELEDDAATESGLEELREELESDLADLREELESVESQLDERIDLLTDRHDELAAESATDDALESLRADHRDRLNETASDVQALQDTLEAEYTTDEELQAALDRRVHRSLGHLAAFAIGVVGLVATLPLAIAGSPAAAVTFLGGAGTLGFWRHAVGPSGVEGDGLSLRDRLP